MALVLKQDLQLGLGCCVLSVKQLGKLLYHPSSLLINFLPLTFNQDTYRCFSVSELPANWPHPCDPYADKHKVSKSRTCSWSWLTSATISSKSFTSWPSGYSFLHFAQGSMHSEAEVIENWKKSLKAEQSYFEALFVLGPMGSGKSTFISQFTKEHDEYASYAYVDTDEIMQFLDGYNYLRAEQYYPIARKIAILLTDWLLEQKISFIAEGTCVKYEELQTYIIRLKDSGYKIKVYRLEESLDVCLDRARKRQTRQVSDDYVKQIYSGSQQGLSKLFEWNKNELYFTVISR